MSYQAKIKRYLLILEELKSAGFPSTTDFINHIEESGIKISERQLKRDIESLRFEFGLEIHYSSHRRGYFLESGETSFPYFLKLLEFAQNTDLLKTYLKKGSDISEILDFEDYNSFKGIDFMQNLALSIFKRKELKLRYKRFDSETEKEYLFQPYILREYLNRWYVIGFLTNNNELRTFGLDRIIRFSETGKIFKQLEKKRIASTFKHLIGINSSINDKAVQIKISCIPYLANLLKTLPLHASQKVISETETEVIISIHVVVNYELKQRLLMISDQAFVISPAGLKSEMKQLLEEAQKNYSR